LTQDEVERIRTLKAQGVPQKAIAAEMRVSQSCVSLILNHKRRFNL
jgi:predicted DNA-binding protein (UPF0251 family)